MYADLLFLTEFINDCLILIIVKTISGYSITKKRLLSGGATGALISSLLAIFYPDIPAILNIIAGVLLCFIMVHITFRPTLRSTSFRLSILTYAAAFTMGGIFDFIKEKIPIIPTPLIIFFCYVVIKTGIFLSAFVQQKGGKLCRVNIRFQNHIKSYTALIDTGNFLFDKKSGLPVSIITVGDIPKDINIKASHSIDFNSLGCTNGTLEIIYVPFICIEYKGEKKLVENAPLGLAKHKLSASDSYQLIISPEILNKMEI